MIDYSYWFSVILDGAVYGCVYGLFGLCLVVIFRANKLFNFSLTTVANLMILFLTVLLKDTLGLAAAIVVGLSASFALGAVLHFGIMRHITEKKNVLHSSEVLLTVGLLSIVDSVNHLLFTEEPLPFPSFFKDDAFIELSNLRVSHQSLAVIGASLLVITAIFLFFKLSKMGVKMEAVSENLTAARLRGIRASNVLAFAWGLTTLLSVFAGIMIAPIIFVSPMMFSYIFSYSLIAVVIGGLESPVGAVVGGVLIGIVENCGSQFDIVGSDLKFGVVFFFLLIALIVRPRGLWGKAEGRRV